MSRYHSDILDICVCAYAFALPDLIATGKTVDIGKMLTANYILTGTVVEMPTSVVIFGRIINVETVEVESVAQVIVPKDKEVNSLP